MSRRALGGLGFVLLVACSSRSTTTEAPAVSESPIATIHVDGLRSITKRVRVEGPNAVAPILERGEARRFTRTRDTLVPDLDGLARVELAATASGLNTVSDPKTKAKLTYALVDAADTRGEIGSGLVLYKGAILGGDLVQRPTGDGAEDYFFLSQRPTRESVRYRVDVGGFAGLRLVGNVVEMVDDKGMPRARVALPWVYDKNGDRHEARLAIEGCAYNADGRIEAIHQVVAPGRARCDVTLSWSRVDLVNCEGACRALEYPIVVDPLWTTATTKLITRRKNYGFDYFQFLGTAAYVAGGDDGTNYLESVESCSMSTTGCLFSALPAMAAKRGEYPSLNIVQNVGNKLLVAGGRDGSVTAMGASLATAEYFEGTWAAVPAMAVARRFAGSAWTSANEIIVAGGFPATSSVQTFSPTTKTWTARNPMGSARWALTLNAVNNGDVVAAGGNIGGAVTDTVEYYRGGTWTTLAAKMSAPRMRHSATIVGTQLLIAGGNNGTTAGNTADKFVWGPTPSLTPTGSMGAGRELFSLVAYGNRALAAGGGVIGSTYLATAELYDLATGTFVSAGTMTGGPRGHHRAVPSESDFAIAHIGGAPNATVGTASLDTVDMFTPLNAGEACTVASLCLSGYCVDGVCCSAASCAGGGKCNNAGALGRCSKSNGLACGGNLECLSGFCIDGVCCNTACGAACEACSAAKSGGADGVCTKVPVAADPDGNCPAAGAATCGNLGGCDGAGGCRKHLAGTVCAAAACPTATSFRPADSCSGTGVCNDGGADVDCSPGLCVLPTGCVKTCTTDANCAANAHCTAGACVADLVQGAACTRREMCQSGFCVDGVCCENACVTDCYACRSDLKTDKSANGLCRQAAAGTDPRLNCTPLKSAASTCGFDGTCNGTGACRKWTSGTGCGTGVCKPGGIFAGRVCDGGGTCSATSMETSCGTHVCKDATGCAKPCMTEADCVMGNFCDIDGVCKPKTKNGDACASPAGCASGICIGASTGVPGVCCNTACMGQCESCTTDVAKGTCVPVLGAAPAGKMACPSASATEPCSGRTCDGKDGTTCAGYVSGDKCSEPSCTDGSAIGEGKCAAGKCEAPPASSCAAFACKGPACASQCESDTDCSAKFKCDVAKKDCVPRDTTTCKDELTELAPDGKTERSCAPYKCAGIACLTQCDSSLHCSSGICDTTTRQCVLAPASEDDGGCGCRVVGSSEPSSLAWLGVVAAALGVARRRRKSAACDSHSS